MCKVIVHGGGRSGNQGHAQLWSIPRESPARKVQNHGPGQYADGVHLHLVLGSQHEVLYLSCSSLGSLKITLFGAIRRAE